MGQQKYTKVDGNVLGLFNTRRFLAIKIVQRKL